MKVRQTVLIHHSQKKGLTELAYEQYKQRVKKAHADGTEEREVRTKLTYMCGRINGEQKKCGDVEGLLSHRRGV